MAAKRSYWLSVIALGGILSLYPALSPAAEGSLEERIRTLEKAQQEQKTSLPVYSYSPGKGIRLESADKSSAVILRGRFHERLMFWDSKAKEASGFSQGEFALRRLRLGTDYYWDYGFYRLAFEFDFGADLGVGLQTGVFEVDFAKLNSLLPKLKVGPRVSTFFNKHDSNWSSANGGLFDRTMFQDGAGIGAGTQYNAAGLFWEKLPVGSGTMLFQAVYSNNGLTSLEKEERSKTDKKALHLGWNYEPFSKLNNKWIKGIDVGVGYQLDRVLPGETGKDIFRVRTTERQRLDLINVDSNLDPESKRTYISPGFGWKVGQNWLRTAASWNKGTFEKGKGDINGRMWRVMDELFVWSPKGFLTGNTKIPGSIMLFAGFERDDYEADGNLIGGKKDAYATSRNVGAWYYIRDGLRVGLEYGQYEVDKIAKKGADALEDVKQGDSVKFDTFEMGLVVEF